VHPENGDEPDILLQRADVAMYAAKANRNGFELYAAEADPYSPRRLALVSELREAVQHRQLNLHYQPKCEIATGRVTGAEALLRWPHPRHGQVPPDEFIPIAEQTGAIRPLTLFVVGESLAQCRLWREQGLDLDVAVNLSARSLVDAELPDQVDGLLAASGLPPSILTLEITESSLMADSGRALGVLSRLRDLGVRLSIDDFGTGYSSLSYLKRLPVSEVKIDRSFVVGLADDDNDMVIVRSIVDLGHNLGLTVVAEGVEDSGSWARLRELGCDLAQGYLISPPQPPAQLGAVLAGPVTVEGSHGASRPLATSPRRR
ncbi:MAG: putative bifunctional diguanylate cyclase/phosphodiesterase, partial [Acidimicrobiales bacterium]